MKMYKKHMASLVTLACLVASSAALAAPYDDVPDPVKGDAGIQMNRMRNYLERERVNRQIAEDRAATKNKVESEAAKQAAPGEVITFELKKIVTDPSAVLTDAELDIIIKPYEGNQMGSGCQGCQSRYRSELLYPASDLRGPVRQRIQ